MADPWLAKWIPAKADTARRLPRLLRAVAAARQAGSESRFQLIDNTDVAGTIPYLPKG